VLIAIKETVDYSKLVRMIFKGFTKQRMAFIKGIMACEKILDWTRLWDEFVWEELLDEDSNGGQYKNDDENISLANHANKGKGKFKNTSSGKYTS
jgi:hypothetical protein